MGTPLPLASSIVVVTEFSCRSLTACIALWLRFRWHAKPIAAAVPGSTTNGTVTCWRDRRIIHVSLWESTAAIYSLGKSRRHVETVRWALMRGDIRTTSVVYQSLGTWRDVALRDRAADPALKSPL